MFITSKEQYKNHCINDDDFVVIIGGGPVGCYLAYQLLSLNHKKNVILFERKMFVRPQVIRIPYSIANSLPLAVKEKMWADSKTRSRIFDPSYSSDNVFWPTPDYSFWPWISVSAFQKTMFEFLKTDLFYKNRFYFIPDDGNIDKELWHESILKEYSSFNVSLDESVSMVFCTCGKYSKNLRHNVNLLEGKGEGFIGHGIYLIYQNKTIEDYKKNGVPMSYIELGKNGISYAASNNKDLDVQLYTYPGADLIEIFNDIPDEFIRYASYNTSKRSIDMVGKNFSGKTKKWFDRYKLEILKLTDRFNIELPSDLAKIKVYYAARTEYYWDKVVADIAWGKHSKPLLFLGDSAGSTDYKSGLSMGRGLLSVQKLTKLMMKNSDLAEITDEFQQYWDSVVNHEFNKGPGLSSEPWIKYKYLVKDRKVIFPDKKIIHYSGDNQYVNYLGEFQSLKPDFYQTSHANAVLFVNTSVLSENIQNIICFSKNLSNSKIIAVVKSDGYGLGANLVSEIVINNGIDCNCSDGPLKFAKQIYHYIMDNKPC